MGKGNKILINFIVELIKVLTCVDAVFKLLHVEVASKATDRNEKKKNLWTVLQFLNMNRMGFMEFWKIIPVFAQGKEL